MKLRDTKGGRGKGEGLGVGSEPGGANSEVLA